MIGPHNGVAVCKGNTDVQAKALYVRTQPHRCYQRNEQGKQLPFEKREHQAQRQNEYCSRQNGNPPNGIKSEHERSGAGAHDLQGRQNENRSDGQGAGCECKQEALAPTGRIRTCVEGELFVERAQFILHFAWLACMGRGSLLRIAVICVFGAGCRKCGVAFAGAFLFRAGRCGCCGCCGRSRGCSLLHNGGNNRAPVLIQSIYRRIHGALARFVDIKRAHQELARPTCGNAQNRGEGHSDACQRLNGVRHDRRVYVGKCHRWQRACPHQGKR